MDYLTLQEHKRQMQVVIANAEAKMADEHARITYRTVDDEDAKFLTITFDPIVGTLSAKEKFLIKAILIEHGTMKIAAPEALPRYPYRDFMLAAFSKQPFSYSYNGKASMPGEIVRGALALFKKYMAAYTFDEAYADAINRYHRDYDDWDVPPGTWFRQQFSSGGGWATSR